MEKNKEIELKLIKIIRKSDETDPLIALVRYKGREVVLKDFSQCNFIMRQFVGPWLLNRESIILKRLNGIKGVPKVIRRIGKNAMLYEKIGGISLNLVNKRGITPQHWNKMQELVKKIHTKGVIHFDLRQRNNILISPNGCVYFVDFATALYLNKNSLLLKELFHLLSLVDKSAILKFKHRMFPEWITAKERPFLKKFLFIRKFWVIRKKKYRSKDIIK